MNDLSITLPTLNGIGRRVGKIQHCGSWSVGRALLLMACLTTAGVGSRPAAAQVGFPVTDPGNAVHEATLLIWQEWMKDDAVDKLIELYNQHRRLGAFHSGSFDWRDAELELLLLELTSEAGGAFGYGLPDLEARLRARFPGTEGFSASTLEGIRRQAERHLQTARNQVQTYQQHYELVRDSRHRMEGYWAELQDIVGEQQAFDLLLAMGVLEGEELTLTRQLLAQDLLLTVTSQSSHASDKALRIRTLTQGIASPLP
jgi:Fe2+ transport system protein FeoA